MLPVKYIPPIAPPSRLVAFKLSNSQLSTVMSTSWRSANIAPPLGAALFANLMFLKLTDSLVATVNALALAKSVPSIMTSPWPSIDIALSMVIPFSL